MKLKIIPVWLLFACCTVCAAGDKRVPAATHIVIRAEHMGWGSRATNLTLVWSNGAFAAGTYTVPASVVSNLLAIAGRPWTYVAEPTNSKGYRLPSQQVDPANLGLDVAWVKNNRERLLQHFAGKSGEGLFPNASARQRAWLTNALADQVFLEKCLQAQFDGFWTDDYPRLELRFDKDDGRTVEHVLRISSRSQHPFMLPWQVSDGNTVSSNFDAGISRAIAELLPPGFLLRDRLSRDLLGMVTGEFLRLGEVYKYIRKSTLEETLGPEAERALQESGLQNCRIHGDNPQVFPNRFQATLHLTNWPERLTVPIQTGIAGGVITNLPNLLKNAETKIAPLLKWDWLLLRLKSSRDVSIEVDTDRSPDHQWLRGHIEKAGLGAFYARIQPALHPALGVMLREGRNRASYWAILEDGRYLLYGFSGKGVLDWKPDELGYRGPSRALDSLSIHRVGVFVSADGKITEVVQPDVK